MERIRADQISHVRESLPAADWTRFTPRGPLSIDSLETSGSNTNVVRVLSLGSQDLRHLLYTSHIVQHDPEYGSRKSLEVWLVDLPLRVLLRQVVMLSLIADHPPKVAPTRGDSAPEDIKSVVTDDEQNAVKGAHEHSANSTNSDHYRRLWSVYHHGKIDSATAALLYEKLRAWREATSTDQTWTSSPLSALVSFVDGTICTRARLHQTLDGILKTTSTSWSRKWTEWSQKRTANLSNLLSSRPVNPMAHKLFRNVKEGDLPSETEPLPWLQHFVETGAVHSSYCSDPMQVNPLFTGFDEDMYEGGQEAAEFSQIQKDPMNRMTNPLFGYHLASAVMPIITDKDLDTIGDTSSIETSDQLWSLAFQQFSQWAQSVRKLLSASDSPLKRLQLRYGTINSVDLVHTLYGQDPRSLSPEISSNVRFDLVDDESRIYHADTLLKQDIWSACLATKLLRNVPHATLITRNFASPILDTAQWDGRRTKVRGNGHQELYVASMMALDLVNVTCLTRVAYQSFSDTFATYMGVRSPNSASYKTLNVIEEMVWKRASLLSGSAYLGTIQKQKIQMDAVTIGEMLARVTEWDGLCTKNWLVLFLASLERHVETDWKTVVTLGENSSKSSSLTPEVQRVIRTWLTSRIQEVPQSIEHAPSYPELNQEQSRESGQEAIVHKTHQLRLEQKPKSLLPPLPTVDNLQLSYLYETKRSPAGQGNPRYSPFVGVRFQFTDTNSIQASEAMPASTIRQENFLVAARARPLVTQRGAFTIQVEFAHPFPSKLSIHLPLPVDAVTQTKQFRISSTNVYLDLLLSVDVGLRTSPGNQIQSLPMRFPPSSSPVSMLLPRVHLDMLDCLDVTIPSPANRWLDDNVALQYSHPERDALNVPSVSSSPLRDSMKEAIVVMMRQLINRLREVDDDDDDAENSEDTKVDNGVDGDDGDDDDVQGRRKRHLLTGGLFTITAPDNSIKMVILVSAVRWDPVNQCPVLDAAVLQNEYLRAKTVAQLHLMQPVELLMESDQETEFWNAAVAVWAERCRTWDHRDDCFLLKGASGRAPGSGQDTAVYMTPQTQARMCTCGRGHFPSDYLGVPVWEDLAPLATRVAIHPLYTPCTEEPSYLLDVSGDDA